MFFRLKQIQINNRDFSSNKFRRDRFAQPLIEINRRSQ